MNFNQLIQRIGDAQAELARDAMEQPASRDSFEYGRVVGMYAGLERAKEVLTELILEQDRRTRNL